MLPIWVLNIFFKVYCIRVDYWNDWNVHAVEPTSQVIKGSNLKALSQLILRGTWLIWCNWCRTSFYFESYYFEFAFWIENEWIIIPIIHVVITFPHRIFRLWNLSYTETSHFESFNFAAVHIVYREAPIHVYSVQRR